MRPQFSLRRAADAPEPVYISRSGDRFPSSTPLWRAPDGSPLMLPAGRGLAREDIDQDDRSLWRYAAAIRVDTSRRVSLGEGLTPLVTRSFEGRDVAFKLEYMAPTGSFKDRGMSVLITYLNNAGVERILEDSSGNAGASMAAYTAACRMGCRILVPASAPSGKLVQMAAMGADVAAVAGSRQDVAEQALREAEDIFYASHNWQPFFLEGTKTLAFELWEQSGFAAPDVVIVPLGYGSNVLGLHIGFSELIACGAISRMPRIVAVQAANCSSFGAVLDAGADEPVDFDPKPTVAGGIASQKPVRVPEVLSVLGESGGCLIRVSEEEIAAGLRALMREGLFVEPTSASAGAALSKALADGRIAAGESVVVVLTGSGLKAVETIEDMMKAANSQ